MKEAVANRKAAVEHLAAPPAAQKVHPLARLETFSLAAANVPRLPPVLENRCPDFLLAPDCLAG